MNRYNDFNSYLRRIFGCRIQKITVDAGLYCPNRDGTISKEGCIFCNEKGSGTGAFKAGISITKQLEQGKKFLGRRYKAKKFIAYFQSFTNTYAPVEKLKKLYEEALDVKDVLGLSIGTRPDCINEPVLDLLQTYTKDHLIWIEYGLQSVHDKTLAAINRGHNFAVFRDAVKRTKDTGIKICTHVILGLPGETRKDMIETARTLARMEIDGVKIHLLYVIKGTKLDDIYKKGRYKCLEQQEYVDLVCDFLEHIPESMVIQRLTGDPHPRELIAPLWSVKKSETLARIKKTLKSRNSWQGKKLFS